jgi:hypothetical protein
MVVQIRPIRDVAWDPCLVQLVSAAEGIIVHLVDSCSCSRFFVRMLVLKCYSFGDGCLIFAGSLHFCCDVLFCNSAKYDVFHLLSPTAREAGKPTIKAIYNFDNYSTPVVVSALATPKNNQIVNKLNSTM